MESKRVFRILNHFRPTLPHIKCPGKSIFVLNWNKNLERIVMFLENKYIKFKGLNLTIETLDGLLKHNGPILNLSKIKNLIGIKNLQNKMQKILP